MGQLEPNSFMPDRLRRLLLAAVRILAVVHLLTQLAIWLPLHWNMTDFRRDMPVYYHAAQAVRNGTSPYTQVPAGYGPNYVPRNYYYPSPVAAALSPLGGLSLSTFGRIWYLALFGFFWGYCWCLATLFLNGRRPVLPIDVLVAGLVLTMWPGARLSMTFGNIEPVIWCSIGCALVAAPRRPLSLGALLAFAALIKIHPLWTLFAAIYRTGKKAALGGAAMLIGGLLLGGVVCGFDSYLQWWRATAPVATQGTFIGGNYSVSFAVLRLLRWLGWWHYTSGPLPAGAKLYLSLAASLAPLTAIYLTRRLSTRLSLACIATTAALFSPLCWVMYYSIILAPLAIYCGERFGATPPPKQGNDAPQDLQLA